MKDWENERKIDSVHRHTSQSYIFWRIYRTYAGDEKDEGHEHFLDLAPQFLTLAIAEARLAWEIAQELVGEDYPKYIAVSVKNNLAYYLADKQELANKIGDKQKLVNKTRKVAEAIIEGVSERDKKIALRFKKEIEELIESGHIPKHPFLSTDEFRKELEDTCHHVKKIFPAEHPAS